MNIFWELALATEPKLVCLLIDFASGCLGVALRLNIGFGLELKPAPPRMLVYFKIDF